ncbi:MAG: hypothetical protein AMXMBFR33_23050 [Candidatus Xenobia bacterium]
MNVIISMRLIWLTLVVALTATAITWRIGLATPVPSEARPFTEPVVLSSQDGVLEVVLSARQGQGKLDTVALPVKNMMLFSYRLMRGRASNGQGSGENLYPGPTLQVQPGDTLIVRLENKLNGLSIPDFFNPAFTPTGQEVPLLPPTLREAPFNLHTHGLHVSPMGNSDNVLLSLPAGAKNTYSYQIPSDHPQGMYWYHGHLHTLTTAQTYFGLAGLLIIGRADGNLPAVTEANLPIRNMAIQYNMVFDRQGGLHQLTNPYWPQFVSTRRQPAPGQLESGSYRPLLAPVNFQSSAVGTQFITNWYTGPLSINNHRGQFQCIPSNLLRFRPESGPEVAPDPSLPDSKRDVQYTVNGQFQPEIRSRPGQTEIWVLSNISDVAYVRVRLTETATGRHPRLLIVGQDGLPYPQVQTSTEEGGTVLSIPPASRYALAVTIPKQGELVLEMPPAHDLKQEFRGPGVAYTNRFPKPPSAVLGTLSVDPELISYFDGFFLFPTQVLLRATAATADTGTTVALTPGQALGSPTSFVETRGMEPAVKRSLIINGGFLDPLASNQDPKAFIYAFDSRAFPHTPLLRPRLDTVEEWTFTNFNNDEHPIHIHVNDFQVTELVDPVAGTRAAFQPWGQDNANVPAPLMGPGEAVIAPGVMSLRTKFSDFLGTYVMHCHRLNHEDNGLMTMVNVIPSVSSYAVAQAGSVQVRDGQGDRLLATVEPFAGAGPLSLALGDVNGDTVLDLVAGTGPGVPAQVVAYSGAGSPPFREELARFSPFDPVFSGGVSVTAGNLDGNAGTDNIVVATGPGTESRVRVFSTRLPAPGQAPAVFGQFSPYPGQRAGVTVTVGMIEAASGRNSIITAPGPGQPATIRAFRYEVENPEFCGPGSGPARIAEFLAFGADYKGGVTLASDWMSAGEGGAQTIVVGQRAAPGEVRVYSSGSALDGYPPMYNQSPTHHEGPLAFRSVFRFRPFEGTGGVAVATTSTTAGADLLVRGAAEVRKYQLLRAQSKATSLSARLLARFDSPGPGTVGGD